MAEPSQVTTSLSFPYPGTNQTPADVPLYIRRLAEKVEQFVVGIYASEAARDAAFVEVEGQMAYTSDTNKIWVFDGSTWLQVFPALVPTIRKGTTAPSNGTGIDGDVYFRY